MNDPISQMITHIHNAGRRGKDSVTVGFSKMKLAIAEILEREGYIKTLAKKGKKIGKTIEISLAGSNRPIHGIERISLPSRRMYSSVSKLYKVQGGHGLVILSTPKGLLSHIDAKKEKVGGEVLMKIW
ncbi:30S ribosomal protein S8 [Candidatus Parcubacteria bacterium]|nr:30S ribosomal protein S8 [Candidatus Parcubacteria bacterium]